VRYSDFANQFLVAAYVAAEELQLPNADLSGTVLDNFEFAHKDGWIISAIEEFTRNGWFAGPLTGGGERDQPIDFTATGLRQAEALIDQGVRPKKSEGMETSLLDTAIGPKADEESQHNEESAGTSNFDSADWTGISAKIDKPRLEMIKSQANALLLTIEQSDCDQRTKGNAKKHVEAIIALMEAPDPPWENIVDLLNSKYLTAFLNVTAMLSLIFGT
jgi:hypothetical protein